MSPRMPATSDQGKRANKEPLDEKSLQYLNASIVKPQESGANSHRDVLN